VAACGGAESSGEPTPGVEESATTVDCSNVKHVLLTLEAQYFDLQSHITTLRREISELQVLLNRCTSNCSGLASARASALKTLQNDEFKAGVIQQKIQKDRSVLQSCAGKFRIVG
jgi:hypothetical protein